MYNDGPDGRRFLLLERVVGDDSFWQPPGGSLEPGESPAAAARRETFEETGFDRVAGLRDLELESRFRILPAWRAKYAPGVTHNVQHSWAARVDAPGDVRLDRREHRAYVWATANEARALVRYEPNRRAIDLVERDDDAGARREYGWELARRTLALGRRTLVMGILNVTPDSFSDGGRYSDVDAAVARALRIEAEGADVLDVGGESSRPGAAPVGLDEEVRRVLPVVERLAGRLTIPISIDTTRAETARRALDAGAEIVNDISALKFDPELANVVARARAALVLMHMRGDPRTMHTLPPSPDVFAEIRGDFHDAVERATDAGVESRRIALDAGVGFGKTLDQNVALLAGANRFRALDLPILVGASRKSFLGRLTGRAAADDRTAASVASVVAAVLGGAHMVRVHDVAASVDAARVADAVLAAGSPERGVDTDPAET